MTELVVRRTASFVSSILAKVIVAVAGILLVPVYASYLTKQEYGYWLVILSIVNYLFLANFGIAQTVANYVAKNCSKKTDTDRVTPFVSTSWAIYQVIVISMCIIITIGMIAYFGWPLSNQQIVFWVVGITTLLAMPWQLFSVSLRSVERIHEEQMLFVVAMVIRAIGFFVLLISGFKLLALAVLNAVTLFAPRYLAKLRLHHLYPTWKVSYKKYESRLVGHIISPAFGFFTIQIAGLLVFSTDNIVIATFLGAKSVPAYAIPMQMVMLVQMLIQVYLAIYYPTISRYHKQGEINKLRHLFVNVSYIMVAIGSLSVITLYFSGLPLLDLWVRGQIDFNQSVINLLLILLLVQLFLLPSDVVLMATSNHRFFSWVVAIEGVVNLTLSIWWVQLWGVEGVIAATVISRLLITSIYVVIKGHRVIYCKLSDGFVSVFFRAFFIPLTVVFLGIMSLQMIGDISDWQAAIFSFILFTVALLLVGGAHRKALMQHLSNIRKTDLSERNP